MKVLEGERTLPSGVIIPERPYDFDVKSDVGTRAVVCVVGPGQTEVRPGDTVIIHKFGGIEVGIYDEEFVILEPDEILAIVEGEPEWEKAAFHG